MKMSRIVALMMVVVMAVGMLAACGPKAPEVTTYNITMWVSEKEGVAEQFQAQIAAFNAANPDYKIVASIEGVTEADAGSKVVADVASAPDIYCFAQDQLVRLVQAAALAKPGNAAAATIKANNDAGAVNAASVADTLYAYPMTSDNGYYMYYDTSIISEEEAGNITSIIAACVENGKDFRFALENAWYTASFFFGAGCSSTWTMNEAGEWTAVNDDFNSEKGLIAMKGMQELTQSSCYNSDADHFENSGAIVTGIWNAEAAEEFFGENFGVTKLPCYTVDGVDYQLGSYSGNKLMGVKPQADAEKAAVLSKLAQYLTGEECQLQRYNSFQWGPSNIAAQNTDAVKANPSLGALVAQNAFAVPQGNIHGSWWDIAKVLGAQAKAATSADDLQNALNDYEAAINAVLNMTDEQKQAWSVIGNLKALRDADGNLAGGWDVDYGMTQTAENTWESAALEMVEGGEFKVRQGASWDVNFGADGVPGGANIVIEATGTYKVVLVYDGTTATITVVAVE